MILLLLIHSLLMLPLFVGFVIDLVLWFLVPYFRLAIILIRKRAGYFTPGGEGVVLGNFLYIRRLSPFFWFKLLNFNIFWGFQKV